MFPYSYCIFSIFSAGDKLWCSKVQSKHQPSETCREPVTSSMGLYCVVQVPASQSAILSSHMAQIKTDDTLFSFVLCFQISGSPRPLSPHRRRRRPAPLLTALGSSAPPPTPPHPTRRPPSYDVCPGWRLSLSLPPDSATSHRMPSSLSYGEDFFFATF